MIVDLRSDTVTRPCQAMLQAMMTARVGDDVLGDDPTVRDLELMAAQLAGKDAALFTPSGTMANQIAIRCWTQPGDEVLMEAGSHPYNYEAGAAAAVSGVQIRAIPAAEGLLDPEAVFACVRGADDHYAPATLLTIENTSNRGGGTIYSLDRLDALTEGAHARGLRVHMDGARVFNAAIASGTPLRRIAQDVDSLSFCLSKGLGAPVGSLLVGPRAWIARARRVRKMLGGGMRQSGFLAAAGIYALTHNIARLADDHRRAAALHAGLIELGYTAAPPATNMVYVDLDNAPGAVPRLQALGVRCFNVSPHSARLVTHLDVNDEGVARTLGAFAKLRALTAS